MLDKIFIVEDDLIRIRTKTLIETPPEAEEKLYDYSFTDIRPGDDLTGFDPRVIAFVEATFVS
jgi:hypothetical protein